MSRAALTGGLERGGGLMESAIGYALGAVRAVTPELLPLPTPCRGWDLRMLLRHGSESLAALREGIGAGRVGLLPSAEDPADPAATFRERARLLVGAWTGAGGPREVIAVGDRCMPPEVMDAVGALEIAVHGWDISRACGHRRPIPAPLATALLAVAPVLVPVAGRHPLFAAPVAIAPATDASDRLAAFLGRVPRAHDVAPGR